MVCGIIYMHGSYGWNEAKESSVSSGPIETYQMPGTPYCVLISSNVNMFILNVFGCIGNILYLCCGIYIRIFALMNTY